MEAPDKYVIIRENKYREMSNETCTELRLAAESSTPTQREQLAALSGRVYLCNHNSNIWYVPNGYDDPRPNRGDAVGRFWRCNSKFCSSCLARQSRLTRRKLTEAVAHQKPKTNERYYFATFTIPNPDLSLLETRAIVNYAWSLFRKRSLCVALIRGGVKSEEFTITKNGFHYHLHCLWLSKWMLYNEVRRVWTDCVTAAFAEFERPIEINTTDGLLNVKVKVVIPSNRMLQEVCKYVTKADSWTKVKRSDLVEVAMIRRWHRMFELFGSFSQRSLRAEGELPPIVHTRSLSDGGSAPAHRTWRHKADRMTAEFYLQTLEDDIDRAREYGLRQLAADFPGKTITTFDCM